MIVDVQKQKEEVEWWRQHSLVPPTPEGKELMAVPGLPILPVLLPVTWKWIPASCSVLVLLGLSEALILWSTRFIYIEYLSMSGTVLNSFTSLWKTLSVSMGNHFSNHCEFACWVLKGCILRPWLINLYMLPTAQSRQVGTASSSTDRTMTLSPMWPCLLMSPRRLTSL